jgi:hypothetical protein
MKSGRRNPSTQRIFTPMIFWPPQIQMTTTGLEPGPQRITLADTTIIIIIIIYCTTTTITTTHFITDPSLHSFISEEMKSP